MNRSVGTLLSEGWPPLLIEALTAPGKYTSMLFGMPGDGEFERAEDLGHGWVRLINGTTDAQVRVSSIVLVAKRP